MKLEISDVIKAYQRAYDYDKANKALANESKAFASGDGQWPADVRRMREADGNLCLTVNMCPAFIAQVANDIRMAAPSVRVIATGGIADDEPDKKKRDYLAAKAAGIRESLIRHVESRSMAQKVPYSRMAGDLVTCGYGAVHVKTEYASETSLLQEIRIMPVMDAVAIVWSEDGYLPTREDSSACWVPVDLTREEFKRRYPDASMDAFDAKPPDYAASLWQTWTSADTIRIAEYFYKVKEKGEFVSPDGSRLIPASDPDAQAALAAGGKLVKRETTCIYRAVISITEVLEEPVKWPGKYIPVIPAFGPEIQIGIDRKRFGLIEHAKDAQRRVNFFASAHAQAIAIQPKAPFIGTEKHFEGFEAEWAKANRANMPYLRYNPDPMAPGGPQRSQPAIASSGYAEGLEAALGDMKRIIGIYDAGLGQKSNETSGKAILARQREGDVGSYEYAQNFAVAVQHVNRVVNDLAPRIYDTQRTLRIMGEDGKIDSFVINQAQGVEDAENAEAMMMVNDISAGEYDIVLDQGPSYTTKRDEAREAMMTFAQSDPGFMQAARDVVAKAAGMQESVVKRLRATIPPMLLQAEEQEEGGQGPEGQQQQVPPPEMIAQQVEQEVMQRPEFMTKQSQARKAEADAVKAEAEAMKAQLELQAMQMPQQAPPMEMPAPQQDPIEAIQLEAIKKHALNSVDFEFEQRRAKLGRDASAMTMIGGDGSEGEPSDMGPSPIDVLAQSMAQQGEAIRMGMAEIGDGMKMLAQASMAKTVLIRDDKGRAAGAEKVLN